MGSPQIQGRLTISSPGSRPFTGGCPVYPVPVHEFHTSRSSPPVGVEGILPVHGAERGRNRSPMGQVVSTRIREGPGPRPKWGLGRLSVWRSVPPDPWVGRVGKRKRGHCLGSPQGRTRVLVCRLTPSRPLLGSEDTVGPVGEVTVPS